MSTEKAFQQLEEYIVKENFLGYDPYDILNAKLPLKYLGKWPGAILTQIQKKNPINIRPLLGIKKEISPTAFGLFLQGYSTLYSKTRNEEYLTRMHYFYEYLKNNYTNGYSGYAWGCNFPWASSVKLLDANVPSSVVTALICRGLWHYYKITKKTEIVEIISGAADFILKDLAVYSDSTGKCISYTPMEQDICYNSSLLAAEVLAIKYRLTNDNSLKTYCMELVDFVIARQKEDGRWNYSENIATHIEREQIDFHQGYILESIFEIKKNLNVNSISWERAIEKGLEFYYKKQFFENGQSLYRIPAEYPVDIHNQSQGIITFIKLREYSEKYEQFAHQICKWTIKNMQSEKGFFYYQKFKTHINKISYIRWAQAFMFIAFSELYGRENE